MDEVVAKVSDDTGLDCNKDRCLKALGQMFIRTCSILVGGRWLLEVDKQVFKGRLYIYRECCEPGYP